MSSTQSKNFKRRNYKQDQLRSKIEQLEIMIKSVMLSTQGEASKEATLSRLFEDRENCHKKLRNLQLNQSRQRRFRARKEQQDEKNGYPDDDGDAMQICRPVNGANEAVESSEADDSARTTPMPMLSVGSLLNINNAGEDEEEEEDFPSSPDTSSAISLTEVDLLTNLISGDELLFLNNIAGNLNKRSTAHTAELLELRRIFVADRSQFGLETARAGLYLKLQCSMMNLSSSSYDNYVNNK